MKYIKHKVYGHLFNLFKAFPVVNNRISFIIDSRESFKGNLDYIIEQDKKGYSNPNAFVFNIANPDTFHNWNREDFLEAIRLGDEIKKHNINLLNDIFVNDVEINGFSKQDIYLDRKKELDDMMESKDITITNNSQKK